MTKPTGFCRSCPKGLERLSIVNWWKKGLLKSMESTDPQCPLGMIPQKHVMIKIVNDNENDDVNGCGQALVKQMLIFPK